MRHFPPLRPAQLLRYCGCCQYAVTRLPLFDARASAPRRPASSLHRVVFRAGADHTPKRALRPHLFGLVGCSLRVRLHLVARVTRHLGNGLFEDGGRLPDRQGRVEVRFTSLNRTERGRARVCVRVCVCETAAPCAPWRGNTGGASTVGHAAARGWLRPHLGRAEGVVSEALLALLQLPRHHLPRAEVEAGQVHRVSEVTGQLRLTPELLS